MEGRLPHQPCGLVWATAGGRPIDPKVDRDVWRGIVRTALSTGDAKVDPRLVVPDLYAGRHTTVTRLLEAGVAPDVIVEVVGHSTHAST